MKFLFAVVVLMSSAQAFAESYTTFTDVFAKQTVSLTKSGGKIDAEEVVLNGRDEHGTTVIGNTNSALKVTSPYKNIIIQIPSSVTRSEWSHQNAGWFTNGDTRILTGEMIINDRPVNKLVEIYASE